MLFWSKGTKNHNKLAEEICGELEELLKKEYERRGNEFYRELSQYTGLSTSTIKEHAKTKLRPSRMLRGISEEWEKSNRYEGHYLHFYSTLYHMLGIEEDSDMVYKISIINGEFRSYY